MKKMKKRPVFLNILQIRLPMTAVVSILHRISGLGLFILLPGLFCVWQNSLSSPEGFLGVQSYLSRGWVKTLVWLFLAGLFYHLFAGIRHLVMDCGALESRAHSRITAGLVLMVSSLFGLVLAWKLFV